MIDLDDLKKRTDMFELCEALGLQPKGKVARCPAHNDAGEGRPNLAIYSDNVHCFRCGFSADAVGLVEKAKGLDFLEAAGFLAARLGLDVGGAFVAVGGAFVAVGGAFVAVGGAFVAVGGALVAVGGALVAVGGAFVAVGGAGVGMGVSWETSTMAARSGLAGVSLLKMLARAPQTPRARKASRPMPA